MTPRDEPRANSVTASIAHAAGVAIVKALYRNARVLVRDEATSALDETTRDRLLT